MIKGYVFQEAEGEFLAEGLYWFPHKSPDVAWVHPESMLEWLRTKWQESDELVIRPTKVYPATYSPETGVQITGEPFDF